MREVRPTIFLGVPRVWEKLASGMQNYASSMGWLKRGLSNWAKQIGLRGNMSRQQGWVGCPIGWLAECSGELDGVLCVCRGSTPIGWTFAKLTVFQTVSVYHTHVCISLVSVNHKQMCYKF